uniref:Uncharacterized protein n=1 Tax=Neogobius melanostomus TaxID=47308 RepID=A0A8C6TK27_9GOBI
MAGLKDRDAYLRLNFLYQVGHLYFDFYLPAAHCVLAQNPDNTELARFYCFTQKTIARRLVLRQDPSVKRTLCKKCYSLLIPGVTATTRQKTRFTVTTCLSCGEKKTFLNNPDYVLWSDRPEAQLQEHKQTCKIIETWSNNSDVKQDKKHVCPFVLSTAVPGPLSKNQQKSKHPDGSSSSKGSEDQARAGSSSDARAAIRS